MIQIDMPMPKCCMECRFNHTQCAATPIDDRHDLNEVLDDWNDDRLYTERAWFCPLEEAITVQVTEETTTEYVIEIATEDESYAD